MSNTTEKKIIVIPLDSLTDETVSKVRDGIDGETIDRYMERWQEYLKELEAYEAQPTDAKTLKKPKYPFPLIEVVNIESEGDVFYDIISGAHRARSAMKAGLETIRAVIVEGTPKELIEMAIRANSTHGKCPSADDVRKCLITLAKVSPEITKCRELAKLIGCSKSLVGLIKNDLKEIGATHRSTKAKKKVRTIAKPKAVPDSEEDAPFWTDDDAVDETETSDDDLQWWTPEWFDAIIDSLQHSEKPDKTTKASLGKLSVGIVMFLAQHGSVKSLQKKLAAIEA